MSVPPNELSVRAALAAIGSGNLSARRLLEACFERIEARDPAIKAWVALDRAQALADADRADAVPQAQRGPLHGLPVGIKDIFDTKTYPTSYGSAVYRGHRPAADAAAVALLREAGAIVAGKTATTEFAAWTPAATHNPWNLEHTPGGSSSGSAAAVADRMIPVAIGTQTLGSVLRPASFCGVVGFKPSYGRISRVGVKPLAESLDTIGVFARDVADAALVYSVLSKTAPVTLDRNAPPKLAFSAGPHWSAAGAAARQAMTDYVASLRAREIAVDDIKLPSVFENLADAARVIHDVECYRAFTSERLDQSALMSASFREGLDRAAKLPADLYEEKLALAPMARATLSELMGDYDAIITLSAPDEAPHGLHSTGNPLFNSTWTLLYASCVSLPLLSGAKGLPIGVQVIAPNLADTKALRAAHWLLRFGNAASHLQQRE
jgi:Asp-tRNA(Asn)/Glu-tRNA(Gln) amidotransferase A subunit family amidase